MHLCRRISSLVLALVASCGAAPSARAQWSSLPGSPNIAVTLPAGASAGSTRTCIPDGAGGVFLVWTDSRDSGSGDSGELYAQHVDATGQRLWGLAGKPVSTAPGLQWEQHACVDAAGGLYLAWDDRRSGSEELYVQRLGPDGEPLWAVDGIKMTMPTGLTYSSLLLPRMVTAPDGGLYLSYQTSLRARVQRLTLAGAVFAGWPAGGVELPGTITWQNRAIVLTELAGGAEPGVLVGTSNAGYALATVTKIGADGVLKYAREVELNSVMALTANPQDFCSDGAGGMLFVAQANQFLYVHRVLADGTIAWPKGSAQISDIGGSSAEVVPGENGGGIVTWLRPGTVKEARAQKFSGTGAAQWDATGVILMTGNLLTGAESYRTTVSDGAGGVIVGVWDEPAYRVQRLNASGQPLWGATGVTTCINGGTVHAVATDGASGVISFHSGPGLNFYVMRASLTGALGSNSPSARLANISARATVGTGSGVLIPGFVVSGGTLQLLVRGIGPTLGAFGVAGAIADPQISIVNSGGATIATNNDWGAAANAAEISAVSVQVGAFALGASAKDAAILITLQPGIYTAVMSSAVANASGVGLVELYEVGGAANPGRLANMSVRAQVGTGDSILIPGLVIGGTGARTLLLRAVGPTLGSFGVSGVLTNPTMTMFSGSTVIGANDNWSTPSGTQISSIAAQVGAFACPANSADAALLVTLAPGTYTAQVSGVGNTSGICLLEVYEVP